MTNQTTASMIIPALPGWYIAAYHVAGTEDGESWPDYLLLHPIIAWDIKRVEIRQPRQYPDPHVSHEVEPLTAEGNWLNDGTCWAIKTPEGRFVVPGAFNFEHEADVIKEFKSWRADAKTGHTAAEVPEPAV